MKIRGLLIILLLLLIGVVTAVGLTSINHPIILKWVTGSARHFGKPTDGTIYTNGQVNSGVNVFYSDEPDSYIISIPEDNNSGVIKFLSINVAEKWIGTQPKISADDYDFIAGHL